MHTVCGVPPHDERNTSCAQEIEESEDEQAVLGHFGCELGFTGDITLLTKTIQRDEEVYEK